MEILIKLCSREEGRSKSNEGARGGLRKVMDRALELFSDGAGKGGSSGGGAGHHASGSYIQEDRQEMLKALSKSLTPEWFCIMLGGCKDSLSVSMTLRALFTLLQERDDYVTAFTDYDHTFSVLSTYIPSHSASPIVLLPLFSFVLGLPLSLIPIIPDLKTMKIYEVIETITDMPPNRMTRALFGALMSALMECLGKHIDITVYAQYLISHENISRSLPLPLLFLNQMCTGRNIKIQQLPNDEEVCQRAKYCTEEVLHSLRNALETNSTFRECCRSREFISPLVLALFSCADNVEFAMGGEQTIRLLSPDTGLEVALSSLMEENYIRGESFSGDKNRKVDSQNGATLSSSESSTTPPPRPYFEGVEASRLWQIVSVILRDAMFGVGGGGSGSYNVAGSPAPMLIRDILLSFPHHALDLQIYSFQESFLTIIGDLISEALQSSDAVPVSNAVALANVLFDSIYCGLLNPSTLIPVLELVFKVAREIQGSRINKALGMDQQQILLADAITVAQALAVVALRRSITYNEKDCAQLLSMINTHMHLLLVHPRRPITGPTNANAQKPAIGNIFLRKALASTLSGSLDDSNEGAQAGLDISRSMLKNEGGRADIFSLFVPERDSDAFITCLLAEMQPFLSMHVEQEVRRNAIRICEVLLKQRQPLMMDLLVTEVKKNKEKKVTDVYTKGFALLQEQPTGVDAVRIFTEEAGGVDPNMVRVRRFEYWLADVDDELQQVFNQIKFKAFNLLGDDQMSTAEIIHRLQASKTNQVSIVSPALTRTRIHKDDPVKKAQDNFLNFYQQTMRIGLSDIANGSANWKKVVIQLKGMGSIWEGCDR